MNNGCETSSLLRSRFFGSESRDASTTAAKQTLTRGLRIVDSVDYAPFADVITKAPLSPR